MLLPLHGTGGGAAKGTRLVQSFSLLGYARAGRDSAHSTQMPPSAHPLLPAGMVRPLYSWRPTAPTDDEQRPPFFVGRGANEAEPGRRRRGVPRGSVGDLPAMASGSRLFRAGLLALWWASRAMAQYTSGTCFPPESIPTQCNAPIDFVLLMDTSNSIEARAPLRARTPARPTEPALPPARAHGQLSLKSAGPNRYGEGIHARLRQQLRPVR